jgi:hypothetical protein
LKDTTGGAWKRQCIRKQSIKDIIQEEVDKKQFDFCVEYDSYSYMENDYIFTSASLDESIVLQSEEQSDQIVSNATSNNQQPADESEQTVEFMDEKPGGKNGNSFVMDSVVLADKTPNVELANFLSRPVNISTDVFSTSDVTGAFFSYNPWSLYFNSPKIKTKLQNFAFIRCDLELKFIINASPFLYGAYIYNYLPLPTFTPDLVTTDSNNNQIMEYSQRPHMWMYPQNSEGGCMTLPFFFPKNWLRTSVLADFTNMGVLYNSVVAPLTSANGSTATIDVQVYAWATNVQLAGPTASVVLQSSDEYSENNGVISKPASAIASAMGMLSSIPYIGKYATASSMGFGIIAKVAHIFGYTNVPVVSDTQPLRPNAFPQFASPEISYPTEKLTFDPKNELSIDPNTVGLPVNDELAVTYISQRESYLCSVNWSTTNAVDDILFTSLVTPKLFNVVTATNWTVHQTPMSMISAMFNNWRGDIVFRFKIICTQFHKGRFRFTFDPAGNSAGNIINDTDTYECAFTKIIDIAKDTDIEIRVPYIQALAWLRCHPSDVTYSTTLNYSLSATPSFTHDDNTDNGTVVLRPVTKLTAPITTSSIKILVFVRGAENLEFANPREVPQTFSPFVLQSTFEYEDPEHKVMNNIVTTPAPQRYLVNFGEAVPSLRTLLRRSNLNVVDSVTPDNTNSLGLFKIFFSRFPLYYGYQLSKGIHSAKGILAPLLNFNFNYAHTGPYQWIAPCFIGQRGAFHWHFNTDNPVALSNVKVYRTPINNSAGKATVGTAKLTYSSDASFYYTNTVSGAAAQSLTNQFTQSGISVSIPNYTGYKFQSTNPNSGNQMVAEDGSSREFNVLEVGYNGTVNSGSLFTKIWRYYSVGTDFNLYFFINTPTLNNFASNPTPN